jgi:hypothetical protein
MPHIEIIEIFPCQAATPLDWNLRSGEGNNDLYVEVGGTPTTQAGGYWVGVRYTNGTPVCGRTLASDFQVEGASVIFSDEMTCGGTPWPTAGVAVALNRASTPVSTRVYDASGECAASPVAYQPVSGVWGWSTPGPGRLPGEPVMLGPLSEDAPYREGETMPWALAIAGVGAAAAAYLYVKRKT